MAVQTNVLDYEIVVTEFESNPSFGIAFTFALIHLEKV